MQFAVLDVRHAGVGRHFAVAGRCAQWSQCQGSRERRPFCQRCFGLRRERDTGSSQNGFPGIIFSWQSRYWTCIQSVPLILARPSLVEAGCCSILNESPTARTAFIPPTCAFEFPRATAAVSIAFAGPRRDVPRGTITAQGGAFHPPSDGFGANGYEIGPTLVSGTYLQLAIAILD